MLFSLNLKKKSSTNFVITKYGIMNYLACYQQILMDSVFYGNPIYVIKNHDFKLKNKEQIKLKSFKVYRNFVIT